MYPSLPSLSLLFHSAHRQRSVHQFQISLKEPSLSNWSNMNEKDKLCGSQRVLDLPNGEQVQNHPHPEPCILLGNTSSFPRSHVNQVLPPSGSVNSYDFYHLPEHVGSPAFYVMTQYTQPNHRITNQNNYFNLHMDPSSGARVFPVPLNHGFVDHRPSSNNYGQNAISFNEQGWDNNSGGVSELCKRKNTDSNQQNAQDFGASVGPSNSSAVLMASYHYKSGVASMEASLPLPDYRGNGTSHRSGAVGLQMDSGMVHNYNNYVLQENYWAHSFQPSSCIWLDQQSISSTRGLLWEGPPMLPYFQGNNIHGGSSEIGHAPIPSYSEISNNHGSANFLHSPPPVIQQHHNLHPSQNIQGVRGNGVAYYSPFLAEPSRVPPIDNLHHDVMSVSQAPTELANQPTSIRIYRSQGRSLGPDGTSRRRDLPRLRTLPADRVALLEFPNFYEMEYDDESFIDHHRDMRLDVDNMSYEDLLALGEHIGTVNTGLSEEDITCHLKTKQYNSAGTFNLEEVPCTNQNKDSCIICQDEYEHNDKLGSLECGHEYHVHCLKQWLLLKNVCPVCKSCALVVNN